MINYEEGKIYKIEPIVDHEEDEIYIGSTTWDISKRFNEHKRGINKTRTRCFPLYEAMSELGVDCFYWEEIESFSM